MNKLDGIQFGKRLKKAMDDAKLTNIEITNGLNLNKNAIGNYKNGQIPNAAIIVELSNFLGISIDYLLTGKYPENLTLEEKKLVELYRNTNDIGQPLTMKHAEDIQHALPRSDQTQEQESLNSQIG